tara:strand:- start:369 stop:953 length:585 start_codon:yes stop_codon:yes gene_type:complete
MNSLFLFETLKPYLFPWIIATPQALLGAFIIHGIRRRHINSQIISFVRPTKVQISFSFLLVPINLIFMYIYAVFIMKFGIDILMPSVVPSDILGQGLMIYVNLITICLFVPLVEEFFFRGFLFNALVHKFHLIYAMLISSGIFAIAHGSFGLLIPTFFSSMMVSFLYYKSKTIWTPVITHSLQNLLVVIVASAG